METLLRQGEIQDAVFLHKKNTLLITLTSEAVNNPAHQNTLKQRSFPLDYIGPHYYVKRPYAIISAEQFATLMKASPNSETLNYRVIHSPTFKYPVSLSEIKIKSLFSLLFYSSFFLGKIAFFLGGLYALFLLIQRLRRPEPLVINMSGKKATSQLEKESGYFPVKLPTKTIFRPLGEITCFYAQDNHVYLYDIEGKEHLVEYTLAELEQKLPTQFTRVHRSTIINSHLIQEIKKQPGSRFAIKMRDAQQKEVITGQSYAAPVKQLFEI
ncbi:MAG: LytR/AlgR family response regulator transcription factor [Cyclobacteriaceae bacterium]